MLLVSIRRVTQVNKGKKTPGIDGETALTGKERMKLYNQMLQLDIAKHKPKPSYRTYIKKKNGKLRPLSIPAIRDRIYQNVVKGALEPQWESKFESISYGFRPKRSCHDALKRIFLSCHSGKKRWIFEGDFKGCFDNLSHEHIMERIKELPYKNIVRSWLKAGYVDNGVFNETDIGSGQGSIVSPLLANIALLGMEDALGIKYKEIKKNGEIIGYQNISKYTRVFYADDFIVICEKEEDAKGIYDLLVPYLHSRGLTLSEEKTRITTVDEGYNFLGLNVKLYKTSQGDKLYIKPSKDSIKKAKETITSETRKLNGSNVNALVGKLNPVITGIANYWSPWVSKLTYERIDHHVWFTTVKFLKRLHPKKSMKWIREQYYKPDKTGQSRDRWILTDPLETKQLTKMAWTPIIRHPLIRFRASPFDATLQSYYEDRDIKEFNRNCIKSRQKLAKRQGYKCPICKTSITDFTEKLTVKEKPNTPTDKKVTYQNHELVHTFCESELKKWASANGIPNTQADKNNCSRLIKRLRLARL